MKTYYVSFILLILLISSCSNSSEMLTVIHPDGSCSREFSALAPKPFLLGDTSQKANPFPVVMDESWQVSWKYGNSDWHSTFPVNEQELDAILDNDTTIGMETDFQTIITRKYSSVNEMAEKFELKPEHSWHTMKVDCQLSKKFRWFYTYYHYRETYPKIELNFELPVEDYLSKEEVNYWFTGTPNILLGLNGIEAREYLGRIEDKYNAWSVRNLWNSEFNALLNAYEQIAKPPVSKEDLTILKDSIYNIKVKDSPDFAMEKILDDFFQTKVFSYFWEQENSPMNAYETQLENNVFSKFKDSFTYKLLLPGKIIQANDAVVKGDTLIWNLSAYRLIPDDYIIEAESRKSNVWTFMVSALIVLMATGTFFFVRKR